MSSNNKNLGPEEIVELTSFNLANRHDRDCHIHFYPDNHIYLFDDQPLDAVSTVIASWFPTFDAERNAERKATPGYPKERYLEEWASRGNEARAIGTFMHAQIEHLLLEQPHSTKCTFSFHGEFVKVEKRVDISHELKSFRRFMAERHPIPFRTEWRICDEDHGIAGTIDFLTRNDKGDYIMYDWKRSNKVGHMESYRFQACSKNDYGRHAFGHLAHLDDMPYNHYCLQQNLYRYMLHRHYGIDLAAMYLVILHPDYPSFHCIPVPVMEPEVRTILSRMKNEE